MNGKSRSWREAMHFDYSLMPFQSWNRELKTIPRLSWNFKQLLRYWPLREISIFWRMGNWVTDGTLWNTLSWERWRLLRTHARKLKTIKSLKSLTSPIHARENVSDYSECVVLFLYRIQAACMTIDFQEGFILHLQDKMNYNISVWGAAEPH